jgi:hypothetical protein
MAIWLLMSNLQDVQLLIYGLLIHYAFWLWASDFYMWNDICYGSNPPPVLCLYTMPVVQIVRRNLVIVSHTNYISHAGKTGTWCRMAYGFMHNIFFYMRLNGYTGSVNWSPCLQIGLLFCLEEIGFFTELNIRTYLAYGISVCVGVLGLCASPSNSKMACTVYIGWILAFK